MGFYRPTKAVFKKERYRQTTGTGVRNNEKRVCIKKSAVIW